MTPTLVVYYKWVLGQRNRGPYHFRSKDNLPEEVKDKIVEIDVEHDFKPGDVILYYRGSYERDKYQPKWSLPARVIGTYKRSTLST